MSPEEKDDRSAPAGAPEAESPSDDEQTVVSRRLAAEPSEGTRASEATGTGSLTGGTDGDHETDRGDDDQTRAVARARPHGAHPGDHTLVVPRGRAPELMPPAPQEDEEATRAIDRRPSLVEERVAGRRRGIAPPPMAPGLASRVTPAAEAAGPGSVSRYAPRELPPAPASRPAEQPTMSGRLGSSSLSSVNRKGRRQARAALASWVAISALSLAGLVTLALQLL